MSEILQRFAAAVVMAVLIAMVGLVVVAGTSTGTARLLAEASRLAGGRLDHEGLSGTLLTGMTARAVRVRLDGLQVEARDVAIEVDWPAVLRGRLVLARLAAASLDLAIERTAGEERPGSGPVLLPWPVGVDALAVGGLRITAGGRAPVVIGELAASGRLEHGVLAVEALTLRRGPLELAASGTVGSAAPHALDVHLRWSLPETGVRGQGTLAGHLGRLQITQALEVPEPVTFDGLVHIEEGEVVYRAEARWAAVSRGMSGAPRLTLTGGRLRLAGRGTALEAGLTAMLAVGDTVPGPLDLSVRGTPEALAIERARLMIGGGTLEASGIVWPSRGGQLDLVLDGIDPGLVEPRAAGRLDGRARVAFGLDGGFDVAIEALDGVLRQRPFALRGGWVHRDGVHRAQGVVLRAGDNVLRLDGTLGARLDGTARVDFSEPGLLWPGLDGVLSGELRLSGSATRPLGTLTLTGEGLAWAGWRAAGLDVSARLGRAEALDGRLSLRGLRRDTGTDGDGVAGTLQLEVAGRLSRHDVVLDFERGPVAARVAVQGGVAGGAWTATPSSATFVVGDHAWWRLEGSPRLRAAPPAFSLEAHCWGNGAARLCLDELELRPGRQAGGLRGRGLPLALLAPLFDAGLELHGEADLDLHVQRGGNGLEGTLEAGTRNAVVAWRNAAGERFESAIDVFRLRVAAVPERLHFEAQVVERLGLRLEAAGDVEAPFGDAPQFDARLRGGIDDLDRLTPLVTRFFDVGDLAGRVAVDARITGPPDSPVIRGGLTLDDGALSVPAAGIHVDRVWLAVTGGEGGQATLEGGARSGGGRIGIAGQLTWQGHWLPGAVFTVKGRRFTAIRLPEGTLLVSPDVRAELVDGQFRVSGTVGVPKLDVAPREIADAAVTPSDDVIVHGRAGTAAVREPPRFVLDGLVVDVGPEARFRGFGLDAGLRGRLVLDQDSPVDPHEIRANGTVQLVGGTFTALGTRLDIERGALLFTGPLREPAVDVLAVRTVRDNGSDIRVGLRLAGTLARIQTQVFSEPAMGELDALSYLTTGRPLSAAGAGGRETVTNAAIGLGLNTALPVVRNLGAALRVDEVGLESGSAEGTSLVVGEQLGKDLYVRYSYGLFNRTGTVRVTYRLSRRLSIEGSSGDAQALDLIYAVTW